MNHPRSSSWLAGLLCICLSLVFSLETSSAQTQVNGSNVTEVAFGNEGGVKGYFVQVGEKEWNRLKKNRSVVASFTESGRDEWSVYLEDPKGKGNVTLNLWAKTVKQGSRLIGDVVKATSAAFAAPTPTPAPQVVQGTVVPTTPPTEEKETTVVNGLNVKSVKYYQYDRLNGYFTELSDKSWTQVTPLSTMAEDGKWSQETKTTKWIEAGRDEWSVYLRSETGDQTVHIDLWTQKSTQTVGGGTGVLSDRLEPFLTPITIDQIAEQTQSVIQETATAAPVPTPTPTVIQGTATITQNPQPVVEECEGGQTRQPDGSCATVAIQQTPTRSTGGQLVVSSPANTGPIYVGANDPKPLASMVCARGAGVQPQDNWMIDMWPAAPSVSSDDLLVQAAVKMLTKHGKPVNDAALAKVAADVKTDPVARYRFAPFMLGTFFEALTTANPTAAQSAYKAHFERYQGCADYERAVWTLQSWNQYQGNDNTIGPARPYDHATLSIVNFNHTPSMSGFMESDPLAFGPRGGETVAKLYLPMGAQNGLMNENPMAASIGTLGDDMTAVAVGAGIGTGAAAAAVLMGGTAAYVSGAAAAFLAVPIASANASLATAQAALAGAQGASAIAEAKIGVLAAEKLLESATSSTVSWGPSLANFAGPAIVVVIAAAILASTVAEVAQKAAFEEKLKKAANNPYFSIAEFTNVPRDQMESRRAALFTLMVKHLIANPAEIGALTLELPEYPCPAGHLKGSDRSCVLEVRLHSEPGLSMEQAQQIAMQNSWRIATAFEVQQAWEKIGLDAYAFGRIADGRFAVPVQTDRSNFKRSANIGAQGGNQGFLYVPRVEYRMWGDLTLKQAEDIAGNEGNRLATAAEVQVAFEKQGLDVFAYGRIDDGRFAVPVQSAQGNFQRGANIGAQGGNQGFFFVRNAAQTPGELYYRGQQILGCAPGTQDEGGLCYRPCDSGYRGVADQCYKGCPAGFRDDGLYCAKPGPYDREGFAWRGGDPLLPNYSGPIGRCEAKYGTGACERAGAMIYPKCKANYHAATVNLCSPDCPSGMTDIGVSCAKNSYPRGLGQPLSACPAGTEKIGALCYPLCRAGFVGKLDWCYKE